jgi:hypothetical protein
MEAIPSVGRGAVLIQRRCLGSAEALISNPGQTGLAGTRPE